MITLALAAIAIPIELRPLRRATLGSSIEAHDVAENIEGFAAVVGELGFLRAVIVGALLSTFAEAAQSSRCIATLSCRRRFECYGNDAWNQHLHALQASLTRVENWEMENGAGGGNGTRSHSRNMGLVR